MKPETSKRSLGLLGTVGLALTFSACGGGSGGDAASIAEMEEVTLSFHHLATAEHPQGSAVKAMAEEVAEKTDGKVIIEPYFSGSLLPAGEGLSGVGTGVADMGVLFATYHPQALPVVNWWAEMQSMRSNSSPHGFLQAGAALQRVWTTSEAIKQEADSQNLVFLGGSSGATNVGLLCKEPISSPAEAKGVKVRIGGPVWAEEVEAMGFTPVSLATTETYEALQRGVIDCELANPTNVVSFSFWDVAKYYHPVACSGTASTLMAVNKDTWESLPTDAQEILQAATDNYSARVIESGLEVYQDFAEGVDEKDVTIVDPRPLNEALLAHQQQHIERDLVGTAPAAVADPDEFLEEWRSALEWGMDLAIENVGAEPDEYEAQPPEDILDGYRSGVDDVDMPAFLDALHAGR